MNYQELYNTFIDSYRKTETSPSEVGEVLVRIASFYPNYNISAVKAENAFNLIHKKIAEGVDDSGKNISSAKAEVIAKATSEALDFKMSSCHISNIEMLISSLKFLQKSLEVEYSQSNL